MNDDGLYIIISSDKSYDLADRVSEKMRQGYRPIGGVSIAVAVITRTNSSHYTYMQAMINVEEEENGVIQ